MPRGVMIRDRIPERRQILIGVVCLFFLLLLLRNGDLAAELMHGGLMLCAETVIPSLFPFMVLAELLVGSGVGEWLGRIFARPMRALFGISGASVCAVLLGVLCGFPIGTRVAVALYDRGEIDQNELSHLLTFCNNTSAAFVISAVGTALWSSRKFGIGLFLIQLFSALLIGFLGRRRQSSPTKPMHHTRSPELPLSTLLTRAVSSSATAMLVICAYVLFFMTIVGVIDLILARSLCLSIPKGLLFGLFELSSGVSAAAAGEDPFLGALLTAFCIGWSGLSVHCQIFSLIDDRKVSIGRYLLAKASQSGLCVLLSAIWLRLAPPADLAPNAAVGAFYSLPGLYLWAVNFAFGGSALLAILLYCKNNGFQRNKIR